MALLHPTLAPGDPEARLVRCPDCGQLEWWSERELADHGLCRTARAGCPIPPDGDPPCPLCTWCPVCEPA